METYQTKFPMQAFDPIMENLGFIDLMRCKLVSKIWWANINAMRPNAKAAIRRKAKGLGERNKARLNHVRTRFNATEIAITGCLAHYGILDSVRRMALTNVDLASVPAEHLASLAAIVKGELHISNMFNCDLTCFLKSVKCERLFISNQTLTIEENQALVQARESGVNVCCDSDDSSSSSDSSDSSDSDSSEDI